LELDRRGIAVSAGSACTAKHTGPSHVISAIKVPPRYRAGVIRISLSRHTTKKEIDTLIRILPQAVAKIRARK
jgi:cysteine desulfurase